MNPKLSHIKFPFQQRLPPKKSTSVFTGQGSESFRVEDMLSSALALVVSPADHLHTPASTTPTQSPLPERQAQRGVPGNDRAFQQFQWGNPGTFRKKHFFVLQTHRMRLHFSFIPSVRAQVPLEYSVLAVFKPQIPLCQPISLVFVQTLQSYF